MACGMREKLYRFMQGRYGNDRFNRFLMTVTLICLILSLFGVRIFYLLGLAGIIYTYFRMLSKNTYKRSLENNAYLRMTYKIRQFFATQEKGYPSASDSSYLQMSFLPTKNKDSQGKRQD